MNRESRFRLAFVDLDGTLLGPNKTVSAPNLLALKRLRRAGVRVVAATGRHHSNLAAFREMGGDGWALSSHGAVVRHRRTGELLLEMTLAAPTVAEIINAGRDRKMSLIAYHREGAYIERKSWWTELYAHRAGWAPRLTDFLELPADGFQKIIWSSDEKTIEASAPAAVREFSGQAYAVVTDPELLEFLAPDANKATGARVLANRLGVDARHTLAFGDGNNDVEILRWAGVSVAMNHGRRSAHAAAKFVSPPGPEETAFARAVDVALSA